MCLLELIRLQTRKMKVKMSSNRVDFPLFGMCLPKVFVDSFENNSLFSTSFLHQWVVCAFFFQKNIHSKISISHSA